MLVVNGLTQATAVTREFSNGPIFNVGFGSAGPDLVHWRAVHGARCLLEFEIVRASGALHSVCLLTISADRVDEANPEFFLSDGELGLPRFDRSLWPPEVFDCSRRPDFAALFHDEQIGFRLGLGSAAVAVEIGAPVDIKRVFQNGTVKIGVDSSDRLCRVDLIDVSPSDLNTIREAIFTSGGFLHRHQWR